MAWRRRTVKGNIASGCFVISVLCGTLLFATNSFGVIDIYVVDGMDRGVKSEIWVRTWKNEENRFGLTNTEGYLKYSWNCTRSDRIIAKPMRKPPYAEAYEECNTVTKIVVFD